MGAGARRQHVWRASVPNALFGDWNPFAEEVAGDWLVEPTCRRCASTSATST